MKIIHCSEKLLETNSKMIRHATYFDILKKELKVGAEKVHTSVVTIETVENLPTVFAKKGIIGLKEFLEAFFKEETERYAKGLILFEGFEKNQNCQDLTTWDLSRRIVLGRYIDSVGYGRDGDVKLNLLEIMLTKETVRQWEIMLTK